MRRLLFFWGGGRFWWAHDDASPRRLRHVILSPMPVGATFMLNFLNPAAKNIAHREKTPMK